MKTGKLKIAVLAVALITAAQAHAALTTFDISFEYGSTLVGSGSVQATDQGGGVYEAQSGSFTVNPGQFVPAGVYDFVTTPPLFSERFGTGTLGPMDDQILVSAGVPALSYDGILFTQPASVDPAPPGTAGINLWQDWMSFTSPSGTGNNEGTMTVTFAPVPEPVPEPTTIISGLLMLLPFGASALRILRKGQMV
jgi:hypothetical protein